MKIANNKEGERERSDFPFLSRHHCPEVTIELACSLSRFFLYIYKCTYYVNILNVPLKYDTI